MVQKWIVETWNIYGQKTEQKCTQKLQKWTEIRTKMVKSTKWYKYGLQNFV